MKAQMPETAEILASWFGEILQLCDQSIFAAATYQEHRRVAVLGTLTRNAKILVQSHLDTSGSLYSPLCFTLVAASRKLDMTPSVHNWSSALYNVKNVIEQFPRAKSGALGIDLGTPAFMFKALMDEALINAGVTDKPTILDEENRNISLGLSINWGMRFLITYAFECRFESIPESATKGLNWISQLAKDAVA